MTEIVMKKSETALFIQKTIKCPRKISYN